MDKQKLKKYREEKKLTQANIAKELGISTKTYNRKEVGVVDFTRSEIERISQILNLSIFLVGEIFFKDLITNR